LGVQIPTGPLPHPLGLLLMLSQLFEDSNKLPLWLWFFEGCLPKLSKKFIKKMITTYTHHIDLFKHPEERFACYLAISTTKLKIK
jgi:hypothetical protein